MEMYGQGLHQLFSRPISRFLAFTVICVAFSSVTIEGLPSIDMDQWYEYLYDTFGADGEKQADAIPPEHAREPESRIAHGKLSSPRSAHPYIVALLEPDGDDWKQFCGGLLVSRNVILTACHCLVNVPDVIIDFPQPVKDAESIEVLAGTDSFADYKKYREQAKIRKLIQIRKGNRILIHPHCYRTYNIMVNDLALMRVDPPFRLKPGSISAFPIPDYDGLRIIELMSNDNASCNLMGWGYDENNRTQKALREIPLNLRSHEWCSNRIVELTAFEYDGVDNYEKNVHVCAVPEKQEQRVCQGDSGGPLVCWCPCDDKRVVGITSWSPGVGPCSPRDSPVVFARIDFDDDWIRLMTNTELKSCACVHSGNRRTIYAVIAMKIIVEIQRLLAQRPSTRGLL